MNAQNLGSAKLGFFTQKWSQTPSEQNVSPLLTKEIQTIYLY